MLAYLAASGSRPDFPGVGHDGRQAFQFIRDIKIFLLLFLLNMNVF